MFITFEGIEGTGKSTQIKLTEAYLRSLGHEVLLTLQPGGSRIGRELRKMLLHVDNKDICSSAELFLYLADRAQHMVEVIRPALESGKTVLCDRFADSTIAYQGFGRGMDPDTLHAFNEVAVDGLWPDLTIILDVDPEIGLTRAMARNVENGLDKTEGRFEAEALSFHTKVRNGYLTWAARYRDRIRVADATPAPDLVFEQIKRLIDEALGS